MNTSDNNVVAKSAHWVASTAEAQVAYLSYNFLKNNEGMEVFADGRWTRYSKN